jgi:hypothetical protein
MRSIKPVALATWLVEHLTFGLDNNALSGDLLEELQLGRSAAWYWRQVCSAIAAGVLSRLRDYVLPLTFCAGWSSLYPCWSFFTRTALAHTMPNDWGAPPWPWSSLLPLGYGMVPAIVFVWLGFLVYVLSLPEIFHQLTAHRLVWGLSASLNVLLVSTVLLLRHFRKSRLGLQALTRPDFYFAFHLLWISIPIALGLLAALLSTTTHTSRLMRRPRLTCLQSIGRVLRVMQSGPIS